MIGSALRKRIRLVLKPPWTPGESSEQGEAILLLPQVLDVISPTVPSVSL